MKKLLLFVFAFGTFADAICATATIDGVTWTYTVVDSTAIIGDESSQTVSTTTTGEITIPSVLGNYPVKRIAKLAFSGCKGLTSVVIPEGVTNVGNSAFSNCSGLKAVAIPSSVEYIGEAAFWYCSNLTLITIPRGVTSVEKSTFCGCSNLSSVEVPEGVTSIKESAFLNCSGLKSVTISASVTSIGKSAFVGCTELTAVNVCDLAAWCTIEFASGANPLSCAHHLLLNGVEVVDLKIPDDVAEIRAFAFYGCTALMSVSIPSNVSNIEAFAFEDCSGLKAVEIHDGVVNIDWYAFEDCSGLTSIEIPPSVESIGCGAFSGCSSLTNMVLPFVGSKRGNSNERDSLFGCIFGETSKPGMASVRQDDGSKYDFTYNFYIPASLQSVEITDETVVGCNAFSNFSGLKSIILPSTVWEIGSGAFTGCSGLESMMIPTSVTSIGGWLFDGCDGLRILIVQRKYNSYQLRGVPADCRIIYDIDYSVVFDIGEHGKRIDGGELIQIVHHGNAATAPIVEAECGWMFKGWDRKFSSVTDSLTVKAIWEPVKWPVVVTSMDGSKSTVEVEHGVSYGFVAPRPTVDEDGKRQIVAIGTTLTAPVVTNRFVATVTNGFSFAWDILQTNYWFAVGDTVHGKVHPETSGWKPSETTFILTAVADGAGRFLCWTGDVDGCVANEASIVVTMDRARTIGATFSELLPDGVYTRTVDGVEWTFVIKDGLASIVAIPSSTEGAVNIPTTLGGRQVVGVCDRAFSGCISLTDVMVPSCVARIGREAFSDCSGLLSLKMDGGLEFLDKTLLAGCSSLETLLLPESVKRIEIGALDDCLSLRSVSLPPVGQLEDFGLDDIPEEQRQACRQP